MLQKYQIMKICYLYICKIIYIIKNSNMSGNFIFFGCWNKIDCEKKYIYRDIVLDYIKLKEKKIKTMFVAGDNWYSSMMTNAIKYYLVGVLVSGYYKLYEIGEDKDIHIAVGNHDEAFDKGSKKNTLKKDCMINTQKFYIDYIKNKKYLNKPVSDPIKATLPSQYLAAPALKRAQSLTIIPTRSPTAAKAAKAASPHDPVKYKRSPNSKAKKAELLNIEDLVLPSIETLESYNISEKSLNIYVNNIDVVDNDDKYIMIIINTNKFNTDKKTSDEYLKLIEAKFQEVASKNITTKKTVFVMGHIPLFLHKTKEGSESIIKTKIRDDILDQSDKSDEIDVLYNYLAEYNYIYMCADTHNFNIMKIEKGRNCVIQVTCGTGGADPDIITENAINPKSIKNDRYDITYNSINSYGYVTIAIDDKNVINVCYHKLISHVIDDNEPISIKTYNYKLKGKLITYPQHDKELIKIIDNNKADAFCDKIAGKNVGDLIIKSELTGEACFKKVPKEPKGPLKSQPKNLGISLS
jgi:hypothetical protein